MAVTPSSHAEVAVSLGQPCAQTAGLWLEPQLPEELPSRRQEELPSRRQGGVPSAPQPWVSLPVRSLNGGRGSSGQARGSKASVYLLTSAPPGRLGPHSHLLPHTVLGSF